jgi:hypothetical protein
MKHMIGWFIRLTLLLAAAFAICGALNAQEMALPPGMKPDPGVALAPARFELVMPPGSEHTVVVNLIYKPGAETQPFRAVASLSDWIMSYEGDVQFFPPQSLPGSAASWIIFSPAESVATPGKVHPIRVTISVPRDATPGDHLAALLLESRRENLKVQPQERSMIFRYRLAALFYIMVPELTRKGGLENLEAQAKPYGFDLIPTLKNYGNTHLRPVYWLWVRDAADKQVAEIKETQALPILAGASLRRPIPIDQRLAPGTYTLQYRVDFRAGDPVEEGRVKLVIPEVTKAEAPRTPAAPQSR